MTWQQMCELISYSCGRVFTPEEIFNYSPMGELFQVMWWFEDAEYVLLKGRARAECDHYHSDSAHLYDFHNVPGTDEIHVLTSDGWITR